MTEMRKSTLEILGLGTVLDIFRNGKLPVNSSDLVDQVFGKPDERGAMVISGAGGIVGAGKAMQFTSRLLPYHVPVIALDLPAVAGGTEYESLEKAFGKETANDIMRNIIRLTYDGKTLPGSLAGFKPKFLLEAIPENLEMKKAHYSLFRKKFPGISIYSVTSGFPSAQLGVNIAHPAFPHEVNKVFEIVEPEPSAVTKLLWSLGLIPVPVSDHWSFVLDVLFCGLTLAGIRYHNHTNTPYWKTDKYIRQLAGPNPFRAHDVIGAKGSNFLTWSCLHHLEKSYGPLFAPGPQLEERKDSGQNWYPLDHFRPSVNWDLDEEGRELLHTLIMGPLWQMTSIMLKEKRSHLSLMNAMGELCAQFTKGVLAMARDAGADKVLDTIKEYHKLAPASAATQWYPETFRRIESPEWQQLYVNAEHDGKAGLITISRESYNGDVNAELNRAIDWLKGNKISRVIVASDFHLSTQAAGADTREFFPALADVAKGEAIAARWSATARRLYREFEISVAFVNGKRCMGGMLELFMHCHYLIAEEATLFSMPEVTLPVIPGMEGCHWPLRRAGKEGRKRLVKMLMEGKEIRSKDAVGWLVDFAGPLEPALKKAWQVMKEGKDILPLRKLEDNPLEEIPVSETGISHGTNGILMEARKAIADCIGDSCKATLEEALGIQAKHSANFMVSGICRRGRVGSEYDKVMTG